MCRTKLRMSSEFFESFFGLFTETGGVVLEFSSEDIGKFRSGNEYGNRFFPIGESDQRIDHIFIHSNGEKRGIVKAGLSFAGDFKLVHGDERMNQKWVQVKQEFVIEREYSFGGTEL